MQKLYPDVFPPSSPFCKFRAWSARTSSPLVLHPQWWSVAVHQDFPHIICESVYITELKIASSELSIRKHSLSKCVLLRVLCLFLQVTRIMWLWWSPLALSPFLSSEWIHATWTTSMSCQWSQGWNGQGRPLEDNFSHFPSHFYFFLVGSFLSLVPSLYRWGTRTREVKLYKATQLGFWLPAPFSLKLHRVTQCGVVERALAFKSDRPGFKVWLCHIPAMW